MSTSFRLLFALFVLTACQDGVGPCNPDLGSCGSRDSATINPASATLRTGDVLQLRTSLADTHGVVGNLLLTWSSNNAEVASVSAQGLVSGRIPGTAVVTVSRGQESADALITVFAR